MPPIEGLDTSSVQLNYPGASDTTGDYGTPVVNQYYAWLNTGAIPVDPTGGLYTIHGTSAPASTPSVTDWLNSNAKTVLIGAGVFLGIMFLTGGRR